MRLALTLLVFASLATAQDPDAPNFLVDFSLGFGSHRHSTSGSDLDDSTSASFGRLRFEAISDAGFGGGITLDGMRSDDDMFATSVPGAEAQATADRLFVHFTFREPSPGPWRLPLRAGVLWHEYELSDAGEELTATSIGLGFELEPQRRLGDGPWWLYGLFSAGLASTEIEISDAAGEWDSDSRFIGAEIGTRVEVGSTAQLGIGLFGRFQQTDESEENLGAVILGFDTFSYGLLVSFGLSF